MKYRIIEKQLCDRTWYEIQYKFLFWWFYETITDISWHGETCGIYNLSFDSKEEAEKYICEQQSPKITIYDTN